MFATGTAVTPLVLPEAEGGVSPYTYTLTPDLPVGLTFSNTTETISGEPIESMDAAQYTWSVTDEAGMSANLTFTIQVVSSVTFESETLPASFTVHGNYPNPFRHATHLVVELPWPARVTVDVLDIAGRRLMGVPSMELNAGWGLEIALTNLQISSGLYLYQLHVEGPDGPLRHVSHFVRIQ